MANNLEEIITAVEKLNDQIYDQMYTKYGRAMDIDFWPQYTMKTNGDTYLVEFLGCVLYNSDDTCLQFTDSEGTQDESIYSHLVRESNRLIKIVGGWKF